MDIDSTLAYRPLWLCFRVSAPTFFGATSHWVYGYMLLLHSLVTVMFPMHLLLGQLLQGGPAEFFKNLTMSLSCAACSLKHIVQLWHLPHMMEIQTLLKQLDECVQSDEEKDYYRKTLQKMCLWCYLLNPPELLYLAWFPFDWRRSSFHYALAVGYQLVSILTAGVQGLTNDIFTPLTLCYVSGHMHLFGIRMSRLGFHQTPGIEIQQELKACFQDFKLIMRLHELTRETVSLVQLVQLVFCGTNLCIIVIYGLFYVEDIASMIHNIAFFAIVCVQLFPSCYFASVLAQECERLPNAIFSGNWYQQSAEYQRYVLIFTQLTLGLLKRPVMAGELIELNLNAFAATVKMAYSLFAVVVQAKNNDN
ncbi:hypothetical protein ACLKA6_018781 [Drosophila palustris]